MKDHAFRLLLLVLATEYTFTSPLSYWRKPVFMLIFSDDMKIFSLSLLLRPGVSKLKGQIGSKCFRLTVQLVCVVCGSFCSSGVIIDSKSNSKTYSFINTVT